MRGEEQIKMVEIRHFSIRNLLFAWYFPPTWGPDSVENLSPPDTPKNILSLFPAWQRSLLFICPRGVSGGPQVVGWREYCVWVSYFVAREINLKLFLVCKSGSNLI